MILTAHQPNFFPWLPYFEKMANADIFVILAECQFEKNNFQNRFKMLDKWRTMSVNRGLEPIKDKRYVNYAKDWEVIKRGLPKKYDLSQFDKFINPSLFNTNEQVIREIKDRLRIGCHFVGDSPIKSTGTQRLVDLCKYYGADTYLSGPSGSNYLDMGLFEKEGIKVTFFEALNRNKIPILDVLF